MIAKEIVHSEGEILCEKIGVVNLKCIRTNNTTANTTEKIHDFKIQSVSPIKAYNRKKNTSL